MGTLAAQEAGLRGTEVVSCPFLGSPCGGLTFAPPMAEGWLPLPALLARSELLCELLLALPTQYQRQERSIFTVFTVSPRVLAPPCSGLVGGSVQLVWKVPGWLPGCLAYLVGWFRTTHCFPKEDAYFVGSSLTFISEID